MAVDVYTWCKNFYPIGSITLIQMKKFVKQNRLTEAQYKEITGYDYPNPQ